MHILKLLKRVATIRKKIRLWIRKINEDGGQDRVIELHKYVVCNKVVVSQNLLSLFQEYFSQPENDPLCKVRFIVKHLRKEFSED